MWAIVVWKTHVLHPRFLLSGVVILFTIAALLAFAFLVGVVTSSTGVSLMATYALFFFGAVLATHDRIAAAVSTELAARIVQALYWVASEDGRARLRPPSRSSRARALPTASPHFNALGVYGSTAALRRSRRSPLASWLFSRKDF